MKVDSFDLVRIIASLQMILVVAVILLYKSKGLRHYLLGGLLVAQASYILCGISYTWFNNFNEGLKILFYGLFSLSFLIGPFLFFYTRSFIMPLTMRLSHIIHVIPFFIFLIINIGYLQIPGLDFFFFNGSKPELYAIITIVLLHIHVLSYLTIALYKLRAYYKLSHQLPSLVRKTKSNWVFFIISGFLVLWLMESLIYFAYTSFYVFLCEVKIVLAGIQCLLANVIVIQGLKNPDFFNIEPYRFKYRKNLIKDSAKNEYLEILLQCMDNESPYLDPLLTLDSLSEKTKIPAHHISQLLNTVLNKSFYDFINSYRINTSKKMLLLSNGSKTILEIMYDSGFSSKSAFNNAFKKFTGLTPRDFREKNANIV